MNYAHDLYGRKKNWATAWFVYLTVVEMATDTINIRANLLTSPLLPLYALYAIMCMNAARDGSFKLLTRSEKEYSCRPLSYADPLVSEIRVSSHQPQSKSVCQKESLS